MPKRLWLEGTIRLREDGHLCIVTQHLRRIPSTAKPTELRWSLEEKLHILRDPADPEARFWLDGQNVLLPSSTGNRSRRLTLEELFFF